MCRFLVLRSETPLDAGPYLEAFAERCRLSKEYQGHGWGVAWREGDAWRTYRTLTPIWEDTRRVPPTTLVIAHARSAFRDEGIVVENNMPFVEEGVAFAFNGELRGVRLRTPGATGAWRIFHLLLRLRARMNGGGTKPFRRAAEILEARSDHVRALNVVGSDGRRVWVSSTFSEDPEYFTLHRLSDRTSAGALTLVSSEPFPLPGAPSARWDPVPNRSTFEMENPATCSS